MIHDDDLFSGFLLGLDHAFNWMEALELAGRPVDKEAWAAYVEEWNRRVAHLRRFECSVDDVPALVAGRASDLPSGGGVAPAASWMQRLKIKERTGTLHFMAAEVLQTFSAHDFRHDLESAIWLLLCMVLRHTLQINVGTEKEMARYFLYLQHFDATDERQSHKNKMEYMNGGIMWRVKDNEPLTKLIDDLWFLFHRQNWNPRINGARIPLTYESVLATFNQALALSDWPENDAALPFILPGAGNSSASGLLHGNNSSGSGSQGMKRSRQNEGEDKDGDPADEGEQPPAKRLMFERSPLRNEVGANPSVDASDADDVFN